ncbi:hypothetical protein B0H17DRAFT_904747, partial [Mycena rosella]
PSRTLLSTVYLWGCVISPRNSSGPYSEDGFLDSALKTLPQDIADFALLPHLVLQTIQAEVLLSYYFLHSARPVEGRYHSATAVCLALDAGLHVLWSPIQPRAKVYPPFPLVQPILPLVVDTERVNGFWAVWILNAYWVAVQGTPSAIPSGLPVDTPWP